MGSGKEAPESLGFGFRDRRLNEINNTLVRGNLLLFVFYSIFGDLSYNVKNNIYAYINDHNISYIITQLESSIRLRLNYRIHTFNQVK